MFEVIFLLLLYFLSKSVFTIIGACLVIFGIVFGIICIVKSARVKKLSKKTFAVAVSALVVGVCLVVFTPIVKRQISYAKIAKIGPRVDATAGSDEFVYNGVTYVMERFADHDNTPSNGVPKFVLYYTNLDEYFQVFEIQTINGDVCYRLENDVFYYFPKDSYDDIEKYYKESAPMAFYAAIYDQGAFSSRDEYEKKGSFDFKRIDIDRELFDKIDEYCWQNLVIFDRTDDVKVYYIYGQTEDGVYSSEKRRVAVVGDMVLWSFSDYKDDGVMEGYKLEPEDEQKVREAIKKVYG